MAHKQVWTKVNAHVDKGVAPLIDALSLFSELQTLSSCEGYQDRAASVSFRYGADSMQSWRELANFVFGFFGPRLMAKIGDLAHVSVDVSTWGETSGTLTVRPGSIEDVAKAIKEIATAMDDHRTECAGDTPCTSQSGIEAHTERPAVRGERPNFQERVS